MWQNDLVSRALGRELGEEPVILFWNWMKCIFCLHDWVSKVLEIALHLFSICCNYIWNPVSISAYPVTCFLIIYFMVAILRHDSCAMGLNDQRWNPAYCFSPKGDECRLRVQGAKSRCPAWAWHWHVRAERVSL